MLSRVVLHASAFNIKKSNKDHASTLLCEASGKSEPQHRMARSSPLLRWTETPWQTRMPDGHMLLMPGASYPCSQLGFANASFYTLTSRLFPCAWITLPDEEVTS